MDVGLVLGREADLVLIRALSLGVFSDWLVWQLESWGFAEIGQLYVGLYLGTLRLGGFSL